MEIWAAKERIGPSRYMVQYSLKPYLSRVPDDLSNRTSKKIRYIPTNNQVTFQPFKVVPSNNTIKSM